MKLSEGSSLAEGQHEQGPTAPYERPRISWREPYAPMSFGLTCARQPGNPGCSPGPLRK
jgi:hypothetical protein